jgi:hypothetical protein
MKHLMRVASGYKLDDEEIANVLSRVNLDEWFNALLFS